MVYHRPLSGMYDDNYRYGSSLSGPRMGDVERRYRTTLSKTHLRSDRGDLGMYTFAGSNLHGGTPAADKVTGVKTSSDLYAPLKAAEYGSGYYDHLRATSPPPRSRKSRIDPYDLYDEPIKTYTPDFSTEYKTMPSKISTSFDYDLGSSGDTKKTTTTKTTITERWVPLTTYIYQTPYHTYYYKASPYSSYTYRTADDLYSYNFVDDYKRYATTRTSKNIDALDLSISSKNVQQSESKQYSEKCHQIQSQLDEVNKWVYEAETKIKTDIANSRSKLQTELAEVSMVVDDTARYNEDLYRAIKKQSKQISTLNHQYEDVNRQMADITDILEKCRTRCQSLQSDLSHVQTGLQVTTKRIII